MPTNHEIIKMGYSCYGFPCEFQILECANTGKPCCAVYRFCDLKGFLFDRGEDFKEMCEVYPQELVFCYTCFLCKNEELENRNKKSWAEICNTQYHIAEFDCIEEAEDFVSKKGPKCLSCCSHQNKIYKILHQSEYEEKALEIKKFIEKRENKIY